MHELSDLEIKDLRLVSAGGLDDLLEEETSVWRQELQWDFTPSAALVKRFVDIQSLSGQALIHSGRVIGYTYTVVEDYKGLVGDVYVQRRYATPEIENRLLSATVEALRRQPTVRRIESQVILLSHPRLQPPVQTQHLVTFERRFMVYEVEKNRRYWPPRHAASLLDMDTWHDRYQDDVAVIIASAYDGHIDSQINDQYRSLAGARRFLNNIVQFPGCGTFLAPASWLAWRKDTGRLCGVILTSMVGAHVGHITQICVAPSCRGQGVGYELLSHALDSLIEQGCRQISLTVTSANSGAIRFYESMGFVMRRRFAALVWDNLRAPKRFFS